MLLAPLAAALAGSLQAQPNEPLDRPYTLRNLRPAILEERYHAMLADSGRQGYNFPRACDAGASAFPCSGGYRLSYAAPGREEVLGVMPIGGLEFRSLESSATAFEAGAVGSGSKGPASFFLDARLFAETAGEGRASYDREGLDKQDESNTGTVSYDSYARFRGNFNLDLPFGRFSVARDAVHWGPGLLNNLVFHQDAVPFNHLTFTTELGPLRVVSLYGDLAVAPDYLDSLALRERKIYAHRYELALGKNVLLGFSEQIVLYEKNIPFLFTPVFPLFIAKGFMYEHANNSNLALDASWRIAKMARVYGEFLLDDLESPSSLFTEDYAQNKWAFMAGAHLGGEIHGMEAGGILEYSHIEPWVYAHFQPFTAQTANLGYPLGNQQGPDSRSIIGRAYLRHGLGWYASLQGAIRWKGTGAGAGVNDDAPDDPFTPKEFLGDVEPEITVTTTLAMDWRNLGLYLSADMGEEFRAAAGIRAGY